MTTIRIPTAAVILAAVIPALAASACDSTNEGIFGGVVPSGYVVEIVSGDSLAGGTLDALPEPFVVYVARSDDRPAVGVPMTWEVTSGLGSIVFDSATDALGLARAQFTSGAELGQSTILARVEGFQGLPAQFQATTNIWVVSITREGFVAPTGLDTLFMAQGQLVEWVNRDSVVHSVVAFNGPGSLFDSGLLRNSERYQWLAPVPGVWDYADPLDETFPIARIAATPPAPPPLRRARH